MTYKTYRAWQAAIGGLLGATVAVSVSLSNWIVPLVAIAIALTAITVLRQRVKEIVADERTFTVAGKASCLTLQIATIGMVILGIILIAISGGKYSAVGFTLEYTACAILIINLIAYTIFNRRLGGGE